MRRTVVLALALLLLVGAPTTTVESDGPPCVAVERDGQIVFEPEGCTPEQQNGSQGGGG